MFETSAESSTRVTRTRVIVVPAAIWAINQRLFSDEAKLDLPLRYRMAHKIIVTLTALYRDEASMSDAR